MKQMIKRSLHATYQGLKVKEIYTLIEVIKR